MAERVGLLTRVAPGGAEKRIWAGARELGRSPSADAGRNHRDLVCDFAHAVKPADGLELSVAVGLVLSPRLGEANGLGLERSRVPLQHNPSGAVARVVGVTNQIEVH